MTRRRTSLLAIAGLVGLVLFPVLADATVVPDSVLQRALRKQRRLIKNQPSNPALWNDLGNLLMLGSWTDEAEEAYKHSLELDADLVTARYNLALLYQQTGRYGRSKSALNRILKHHPEHAWSRYYLGVALAETGHRKAAIRQYAHALRLDRDLADPRVNPHVVDNSLLAGATLRAYSQLEGAGLAPRLYEDRERVVNTMVRLRPEEGKEPSAEAEEAAAEEGDEADEPPRRRRRSDG